MLMQLEAATRRVDVARQRLDAAHAHRADIIRRAIADGVPTVEVARVAGMAPSRVSQLAPRRPRGGAQ